MAVVSSFDQWEKDVFFSAAEEVQQSADLTWQRERTSGSCTDHLEELSRELHMALGTAKWQLDQFQRAVSTSHLKILSHNNTITRHKQFVSAIGTQIKIVENELNKSSPQEEQQNLPWVKKLEQGERDEFVAFLSTSPQPLKKYKENKKDKQILIQIDKSSSSKELVDRSNSNSFGVLKKVEGLIRVKLLRNDFWKAKSEEKENSTSSYFGLRVTLSRFSRSLQLAFLLVLSIFLIVPIVVYCTG